MDSRHINPGPEHASAGCVKLRLQANNAGRTDSNVRASTRLQHVSTSRRGGIAGHVNALGRHNLVAGKPEFNNGTPISQADSGGSERD